jgi:hypothetical protein
MMPKKKRKHQIKRLTMDMIFAVDGVEVIRLANVPSGQTFTCEGLGKFGLPTVKFVTWLEP